VALGGRRDMSPATAATVIPLIQPLVALGAEYPARYSGTPESVEMPAPVSTVTRRTLAVHGACPARSASLTLAILVSANGPGNSGRPAAVPGKISV
jgi:hypothetical protein